MTIKDPQAIMKLLTIVFGSKCSNPCYTRTEIQTDQRKNTKDLSGSIYDLNHKKYHISTCIKNQGFYHQHLPQVALDR